MSVDDDANKSDDRTVPLDYAQPGASGDHFVRAMPRPPGWAMHSSAAVIALLALWWARLPFGAGLGLSCFTLVAAGLILLVWGAKLLIWLPASVLFRMEQPPEHRRLAPWLVIPAIGGLTLLAIYLELPLKTAFWLSRSEMQRIAVTAMTTQTPTRSSQQAGLYRVRRVEPIPGGARLITNDIGFAFSYAGFVYSPNTKPVVTGRSESYVPFGNGWYIYTFVD